MFMVLTQINETGEKKDCRFLSICHLSNNCGYLPIMPVNARDSAGASRDKQGQGRDKQGEG